MNANERIAVLTAWLETSPLPDGVDWEWTGDQEEQAESAAFLQTAFSAALGLMFIILLAQFNSFYNAVLVLVAVVLSTTGVLIGMLVMDQTFSIIMTGTGIVALAGIVVNNNIILIDTYQEYSQYMPRIEAIIRTAQARIRPVLLTTITTMAGLAPMMLGLSLNLPKVGTRLTAPRPCGGNSLLRRWSWAWHCDRADAGGDTVDAGHPRLGHDLCPLGGHAAGQAVTGARVAGGTRLGTGT